MSEKKGAIISDDGIHRYSLWRKWGNGEKFLTFIGLNPSTADSNDDDPTIRRCIQFGKDLNYDGIYMINLFTFRATKPDDMKSTHHNLNGLLSFYNMSLVAQKSHMIIAAWGNHGSYLSRNSVVEGYITSLMNRNLYCLEINKNGSPKHPLYIKSSAKPILYSAKVGKHV